MGTSKLLGDNLTKCWEVACDGLVSHPGGGGGGRNTPSRFILQKPEMPHLPNSVQNVGCCSPGLVSQSVSLPLSSVARFHGRPPANSLDSTRSKLTSV